MLDETVPGASVGGVLATNTSGPRRVAFGTARDLLIGMTVVRADGVVAKSGGRVVKNVAGYDLGKLMIGSFGTLAVITEAVFRLHPLPETRRWLSASVADAVAAHDAVQAVVHSQAVPAAVEVDWRSSGAGAVHVLLEGREDGVAGRAATVTELLGGATESHDAPDEGAVYPWDLAADGDDAGRRSSSPAPCPGCTTCSRPAGRPGLHLRGSAGAGVVYGALPPGRARESAVDAVRDLREVCGRHGGSLVVVDAPAAVKDALDVWGPTPALT